MLKAFEVAGWLHPRRSVGQGGTRQDPARAQNVWSRRQKGEFHAPIPDPTFLVEPRRILRSFTGASMMRRARSAFRSAIRSSMQNFFFGPQARRNPSVPPSCDAQQTWLQNLLQSLICTVAVQSVQVVPSSVQTRRPYKNMF